MDTDLDHGLIRMTAEEFDIIAEYYELHGNTCAVMRAACVERLTVDAIGAALLVPQVTVLALLDEARVVLWQAAGRTENEARELLEAYRNRQPYGGGTPGDVKLRDPVEGVDDLRRRRNGDPWRVEVKA